MELLEKIDRLNELGFVDDISIKKNCVMVRTKNYEMKSEDLNRILSIIGDVRYKLTFVDNEWIYFTFYR